MATLYIIIARALTFWASFFICSANLGLRSAWTIFILARYNARPRTIWMKRLQRPFSFRGRDDRGVMSHFHKSGYRIIDTPQHRVRTIIDAGANIGDETVRFRHFHPDARIFAIEAEQGNFEYLQKNLGADARVSCLHRGIWPCSARLRVVPSQNNEAFRVSEVAPTEPVFDIQAISLEQLVQDFGITSIDILKLDVEGSEYEIFTRNYAPWIGLVKVFIFECPDHERPGTVAALFRILPDDAFDCFIDGENLVLIRRDTGWKKVSTRYY